MHIVLILYTDRFSELFHAHIPVRTLSFLMSLQFKYLKETHRNYSFEERNSYWTLLSQVSTPDVVICNPRSMPLHVVLEHPRSWIWYRKKCEEMSEKNLNLGFPGGAVIENLPANAGDTGSSPGLGRFHMPRSN